MRIRIVALVLFLLLLAYLMWPVCVPMSPDEVASFNQVSSVPIDKRADRDFYVRVFQYREGQWCHCKTRLGRLFFF